ncbi:hypothetical protein ACHAXR_009586 [Thalassiosira sp. AJA248-18]
MTHKKYITVSIALVVIALIIGLSVGLTREKEDDVPANVHEPALVVSNLDIFDKAVALIESSDRHSKVLPSGESMSYRKYNVGQPHVLVMLPGYVCNDAMFSIIAVLPEFEDHHIIAVNPVGWVGTSMNTPISSHEEDADEVVELLKLIGVKNAMVGGFSTDGFSVFDEDANPVSAEDSAAFYASIFTDDMDGAAFYEVLKTFSSNPSRLPSPEHEITTYLVEEKYLARNFPQLSWSSSTAAQMSGKIEAMVNNVYG